MTGVRDTPSKRFWRKVDKNGPLPAAWNPAREGGPCWLYAGSMGSPTRDYGYFGISREKSQSAHRFAYEDLVGPVPPGLDLDHLCRIRHCVNPGHLEPVTRRENLMRGETLPAAMAAKTHCKRGHPFNKQNTRFINGSRQCRTCDRERKKAKRRVLAKDAEA